MLRNDLKKSYNKKQILAQQPCGVRAFIPSGISRRTAQPNIKREKQVAIELNEYLQERSNHPHNVIYEVKSENPERRKPFRSLISPKKLYILF
jgi:hypothetical protein